MPDLAKSSTPQTPSPQTPDPAAAWVRVRDLTNGREYDIAPVTFRPDAHELLNDPAWPDLLGGFGSSPRPAVYPPDPGPAPAPAPTPAS
jgi:hypothetical protein